MTNNANTNRVPVIWLALGDRGTEQDQKTGGDQAHWNAPRLGDHRVDTHEQQPAGP